MRIVSAGGRYQHIDAMRALAVMLVVVAHAGYGDIVPGGSGVTIFFAISGFVITRLLLRERERSGGFSIRSFYTRRLFKLAPPFIAAIAIPTLFYALFRPIDWFDFAGQVFFFFNWQYLAGPVEVLPGSGVVWSLSIEEQFYIGFAIFWVFASRMRSYIRIVSTMAVFLTTGSLFLRIVLVSAGESHRRIYYGTDTRIDGIAIGILAALLCASLETSSRVESRVRNILSSNLIVIAAIAIYLASLIIRDEFFRETFRYTFQAFAAALLILYGVLRREGKAREVLGQIAGLRLVQVIGLASYSIYLTHLTVVHLVRPLVAAQPIHLQAAIFMVVGVGSGIALWHFVERPAERVKNRITKSLQA